MPRYLVLSAAQNCTLWLAKTSYTRKMHDMATGSISDGSDKMLVMIVFLRHLLGWVVSACRSRGDLVLENLALRQQLLSSAREKASPSIDCPVQAVLGRIEDNLVGVDEASPLGHS